MSHEHDHRTTRAAPTATAMHDPALADQRPAGAEAGPPTDGGTILVVEDEKLVRKRMTALLEKDGYEVMAAADEATGRAMIEQHELDMVFLDLGLAGEPHGPVDGERGGERLFALVQRIAPIVPVVVVTGDLSPHTAVDLVQSGAFHYLPKPARPEMIRHLAAQGVALCRTRRQLERAGEMLQDDQPRWHVGPTAKMREVERLVSLFAPSDASILIQGETGTGKEIVAREIHRRSSRAKGPFVPVNCAAVPAELMESELFGHERGAFTGAQNRKRGRLELADGGTLFLDELASMPLQMQAKLLRALQDFRIMRVGGEREIKVDVRVVSACNQDIGEAIEAGDFRDDLYYRICVQPIELPPLRERAVDVGPLATIFIEERRRRSGSQVEGITERAVHKLAANRWPGNIRELRNVIERAVVVADASGSRSVDIAHLPGDIVAGTAGGCGNHHGAPREADPERGIPPADLPADGLDLEAAYEAWEQRMVTQALARTDGNQSAAARLLHLTRDKMRTRVDNYGLHPKDPSGDDG